MRSMEEIEREIEGEEIAIDVVNAHLTTAETRTDAEFYRHRIIARKGNLTRLRIELENAKKVCEKG
jgi:hypothetical protein